jgi:Tfp pilus assembly protein PilO
MILNLNTTKISSQINPLFVYLQKQKENQKVVKLVEVGATFFLISFFIFFAIKPTFLTISSLLGDIKSKEILSKELKTKINDVIIAQDLFSQVQERYYLVESSLPINPRFSQATSQIMSTSQNHQIFLNKIDFIIQDSKYFSANISTTSSYLSAVSFVSDILQNRRLMGLDSFTFSLSKNTQDQKISINLPLKIYYWQNDAKK